MARIEIDPNYSSPTFSRATASTDLFKKEDVQALAAAMSTHVHNGADSGLAVSPPANSIHGVAIADGTLSNGKLQDSTIQTGKIADHAVSTLTQVQGIAVSPSTTSSTMTNVPDMTLNLSLTAVTDVLVMFVSTMLVTGGTGGTYCVFDISSTGGTSLGMLANPNVYMTITTSAVFLAQPTGAWTVSARWNVTNGGTLVADNVRRSLVAVEFKR